VKEDAPMPRVGSVILSTCVLKRWGTGRYLSDEYEPIIPGSGSGNFGSFKSVSRLVGDRE
jgi:hypothetical protein